MRLAPRVTTRATQRQSIGARTVQAIGMIAMDPVDIEAVISDHVERNPFLSRASGSRSAGDPLAFEARLAHVPTLRQHIAEQIAHAFPAGRDRALALRLADELDEAGYLTVDHDVVAIRLGVSGATMTRVLGRCREFEPAGLFARDLKDCLALQLAARDELDRPMEAILERLELVATGRLARLAIEAGLERDIVETCVTRLKRCDPKPAASWQAGSPLPVIPVARATRRLNGTWAIALLASAFPKVTVDEAYAAPLLARDDTLEFARAALREARWLDQALRRRTQTIGNVVREIVACQTAFLERGEVALRPLTKSKIAERVGVHETTVGRAVAGKAIETPRGTVALHDLFGSGVSGPAGMVSARAVATRIERMVERENPDVPYSDQRLAELLRAEGIEVARRTVAKYRRQLAIGSAADRQRAKRWASQGKDAPEASVG